MKTSVKRGHDINFTAAANIAGGSVLVIGAFVGVVAKSVVNGEVGVLEIVGVHKLPKQGSLAIGQGDRLYWDNTNKVVNKTNTNPFIGYADSPEDASAVTVRVLLARPGE